MAYGTEAVFELSAEVLGEIVGAEQLDEVEGDRSMLAEVAGDILGDALAQAHLRLIQRRFDPSATLEVGAYGLSSIRALTPEGLREFSTFALSYHGPEADPDQVLGVSLWSRYSPVWLDWEHPAGGSSMPFPVSADILAMLEEARAALAEVHPAFADAELVVLLQHY